MSESIEVVRLFKSCLEDTEAKLADALGLVTGGMPPADEQIEDLSSSMSTLRRLYSELKLAAGEAAGGGSAATEDESAFTYIETIESIEAERASELKARFDRVCEALESFLAIKAQSDDYEAAISPYREEAAEALGHLRSIDMQELPEGFEESYEPKRMLVEAIRIEDFDTAEGAALLDGIGPAYSWKVQQGVLLHKYYLPEQDEPGDHTDSPTIPDELAGDANGMDDHQSALGETVLREGPHENRESLDPEDARDVTDEIPTTIERAGRGEQRLLPTTRVRVPKRVSAASFKRELLQSAPASVRGIVPAIAACACIDADQIVLLVRYMCDGHFTSGDIESGVSYLTRKGVVATFSTDEGDRAYCLSEYGRSLFDKESIRTLRNGQDSFWAIAIAKDCASFDGGIPVSFVEKRLERVSQLIACYAMAAKEPRAEQRITRIHTFAFNGDNLRARAEMDGDQIEIAIVGGDEEGPDDVRHVVKVSPLEEGDESAADILAPSLGEGGQAMDEAQPDEGEGGSAATAGPMEGEAPQAPEEGSVGHGPEHEDSPSGPSGDERDQAGLQEAAQGPTMDGPVGLGEEDGSAVEVKPSTDDSAGDEEPDSAEVDEEGLGGTSHEGPEEDVGPSGLPEGSVAASQKPRRAGIEGLLDTGSVLTATTPTDDGFIQLATYMVDHPEESVGSSEYGALACALTLLECASTVEGYDRSAAKLRQLRLATGAKAKGVEYSGSSLSRAFGGFESADEALILSAYCRALFDPKNPYDYELWNTCEPLLEQYGDSFPSYPELRPLLSKLLEIHRSSPTRGFSERVLDMLGDRASKSRKLEEMRGRAAQLKEKPAFKAMIHGMPAFNEACFGRGSDLSFCMSVIQDDNRDELELVRSTLGEYQDGSGQISDDLIGEKIDTSWRAAVANLNTKGIRKPEFYARKQAFDAFTVRLGLMDEWISYADGSADDESVSRLGDIRKDLMAILGECADPVRASRGQRRGSLIVSLMLQDLRSRLAGEGGGANLFAELLLTGQVSLKDDGNPDIDPDHNSVRYFEPWRRTLVHWIDEKPSLEDAGRSICRDGTPCSDNLRQLRHIERIVGYRIADEPTDTMLSRAQAVADHEGGRFSERLEIAYAFGEINEPQRELLQGLLASNRAGLFESEEFGLWGLLISALTRQIADMSEGQGRQLAARLEKCEAAQKGRGSCELLAQARSQLVEARNFAVVEEYLNRFESGERELPEGYSEEDSFSDFISDEVYTPLLEACQRGRSQQFTRFAKLYVRDRFPEGWSTRHKESSERLISCWPCSGKRKPEATTIAQLFRQFGLNVKGAWPSDSGREHYLLEVRREKRNQSDYPHPISMFGTQARSPLDVIVLHGNQSAREIVNQVSSARVNGMSAVLVDGCLSLQTRRQVAEIFHTSKSKISPFLLIDQVLALYLAMHQETERLPILLKCTLPFTYYQPFIRDGGATADEMFSGRESELRSIINPQGATVVYGGRQLGKTALLERAEALQHDPEKGRFAALVDIQRSASEADFVREVTRTVNRKTGLGLTEAESIEGLCDQFRAVLDKDEVKFVLLLIDEADCFLDSISAADYMPIKPLIDLKRERASEFKFVLAGLHNVVRYKNATANNGIFGQLGSPLCVKPLKPADALRLMSRPLGYLGFDVKRYPHIETILTNTNYYPGILQFFGYELVDTMTKQYGQYYQASRGNPPYELTQEQLGSIMNSRRLNDSIREKFLLSLRLDPRYLALARCVALLTYEREGDTASEINGLSASEALECGRYWEVGPLAGETPRSTEILMDEMVDMGILAKGDGDAGGYRLRMHRFLSIIGSSDSILEAFLSGEEE